MTGRMQWVCLTIIIVACTEGQAQDATSNLLKVRTSIAVPGGKIQDGMTIDVPYLECGYIFCEAPDVFINGTTHYWDYYIDWSMPDTADIDPSVFVLANRYQMPRSYLVLKNFASNFTGKYSCRLHFRKNLLTSFDLTLNVSEVVTSKECNNAAAP